MSFNNNGISKEMEWVILSEEALRQSGKLYDQEPIPATKGPFEGCDTLTEVVIDNTERKIPYRAYANCSNLTSVIIEEGVEEIAAFAFASCSSLKSIALPESLTTLYDCVFEGCESLTELTIPSQMEWLGEFLCYHCDNLSKVYCKAPVPPEANSDMFFSTSENLRIYVPSRSVEAYRSAEYWSEYADQIVGYDF